MFNNRGVVVIVIALALLLAAVVAFQDQIADLLYPPPPGPTKIVDGEEVPAGD